MKKSPVRVKCWLNHYQLPIHFQNLQPLIFAVLSRQGRIMEETMRREG